MRLGMTPGEFARTVGRARSVVQNWERGGTRPLRSSWERIRAVLGAIEGELPQGYGTQIRSIRERLGLTRAEFGLRLELCEKTIENVELQRNQPSRETTMKLKAALAAGFPIQRGSRSRSS